ncbi:MAG TPA: hypothetical protein H9698_01475 [Candidatus Ruthenibacterium merdavium]|uniref:Uncharacterized protein n=1 Tax=Candidatus Ruthenibacterium merdavium TaxID=2838752 RepID=A0A9D2Q4Q6_9FIRM|nr:hypothetical protein [Candidatus Ruthenibacterium merdavium]
MYEVSAKTPCAVLTGFYDFRCYLLYSTPFRGEKARSGIYALCGKIRFFLYTLRMKANKNKLKSQIFPAKRKKQAFWPLKQNFFKKTLAFPRKK